MAPVPSIRSTPSLSKDQVRSSPHVPEDTSSAILRVMETVSVTAVPPQASVTTQ